MSASPSASNPSLTTSAYMVTSMDRSYTSSSDDNDIASLPSESTSSSDLETLSDYSDAEVEWQESIEQLELLLTMVIVPFLGKYLGRKCAYWSWTRFMEWKYPIEVVMSNDKAAYYKRTGAVQAHASL